MMFALFVDVFLLALNVYLAIVNRGTFWGWLSAAFVVWMIFVIVKSLKTN